MTILYTETPFGTFAVTTYDPRPSFEGAIIPDDLGNRDRAKMVAQIDALEATLVPYVPPVPTAADVARADLLAAGVTRGTIATGLYLEQRGDDSVINALNAKIDIVVISSGLTLETVSALIS